MTSRIDLVLFPGLGADGRQFEPQRLAFPDLVVPPWIAAKKRETLSDYALRLSETIAPRRPMGLGLITVRSVSFGSANGSSSDIA